MIRMKPKISFLIAAANEEKTIGKLMDNLERIKKFYPRIEVLAAVDGSTDRTEEIIKKYKFAKILIKGPRLGKNISIHKLTQSAKGDIIVIHDADWIFRWNKKTLENMIEFFKENPNIGGIVQEVSYFNREKYMNDKNRFLVKIGFTGEAVASNLIRNFMTEYHKKQTKFEDLMFTPLIFIIRGGIITKKTGINEMEICDEAKRTEEIMKKGYKFIYSDKNLPYFEVLYNRTSFSDLVEQRTRGFLSNRIQQKYYKWNIKNFYFLVMVYFVKSFFKLKPIEIVGLGVWVSAGLIALLKVKLGIVKDRGVWSHRGVRW
jgi:cellulose synthase/poly-beta-1,6-N-acetylglucosamine synthase-like glycosyltransferase